MTSYLAHAKTLQSTFEEFNITHVPRSENNHADTLANLSSSRPHEKLLDHTYGYSLITRYLEGYSYRCQHLSHIQHMVFPILRSLKSDELPSDKNVARCL